MHKLVRRIAFAALILLTLMFFGIISISSSTGERWLLLGAVVLMAAMWAAVLLLSRRTCEARSAPLAQPTQADGVDDAASADRLAIDQAALDQKRYLRAVMDNVFNGIVTIDAKGVIESFNPTAERMFGYKAEEVTGSPLGVLMPETHRDKHQLYISKYLQSGEQDILDRMRELQGRRKDGSTFPMEVAITESEFQGRQLFIGTIRDISDRKRAERELEETQRKYYHQEKMAAIGTLAAGIVHEIGNPTAAMLGLIQAVMEEHRDELSDEVLANLELIREQVERVIQITRDISEFSSARSPGAQLVDLNGLIGRTVRLMRHDRRFRQIEVRLTLDQQLPALNGIEDHLIQVVLNLLANAADALEEAAVSEPMIEVTTRLGEDRVQLCIEDNGCGMDNEVLEHAMEAFYTTKPVGRGTGLGLSLCHSLIAEHQGEFNIHSQRGQGTRIEILLPLRAELVQPESAVMHPGAGVLE